MVSNDVDNPQRRCGRSPHKAHRASVQALIQGNAQRMAYEYERCRIFLCGANLGDLKLHRISSAYLLDRSKYCALEYV